MSYDPNNAFAKILNKELPCVRVYEDERTLVFMDIMPQAEGHVLIVPKEQASTIFELSEEGAVACIKTTRRIALAVKAALGTDQLLIAQVNGALAGQTVPHIHFHVIPRYAGAPLREHAKKLEDRAKLEEVAQRIIRALPLT